MKNIGQDQYLAETHFHFNSSLSKNFYFIVVAHQHLLFYGRLIKSPELLFVVAHIHRCTWIESPIKKICNYSHMNFSDNINMYATHHSNNVPIDIRFNDIAFFILFSCSLRVYIRKCNGLSFHNGNKMGSSCPCWDYWSCYSWNHSHFCSLSSAYWSYSNSHFEHCSHCSHSL